MARVRLQLFLSLTGYFLFHLLVFWRFFSAAALFNCVHCSFCSSCLFCAAGALASGSLTIKKRLKLASSWIFGARFSRVSLIASSAPPLTLLTRHWAYAARLYIRLTPLCPVARKWAAPYVTGFGKAFLAPSFSLSSPLKIYLAVWLFGAKFWQHFQRNRLACSGLKVGVARSYLTLSCAV